MATHKALNSVLWNFLGTYMSRYSEFDGYWLFGFIVCDVSECRVNLLGQEVGDPSSPLGVAIRLAGAKFKDQCAKGQIASEQVREASLAMSKLPGTVRGPVNGRPSDGFTLLFTAEAMSDRGKRFVKTRSVFVAPHNPQVETRSAHSVNAAELPH